MNFLTYYLKNRKADIELDELGKVILGVILLIILIVIVTVVIKGEFSEQTDGIKGMFSIFN